MAQLPEDEYTPRGTSRSGDCTVPGCVSRRYARGLCKSHYDLWRKKDPNWRRLLKRRRAGPFGKIGLYIKKAAHDALKREASRQSLPISYFLAWILETWVRDNLIESDPNIGLTRAEFDLTSDEAILRAFDADETTIQEIAKEFGVSERTVYRAIKRRETGKAPR